MTLGPPERAPSLAALRMRRSRERRQKGDIIISLQIPQSVISQLAALGWLVAQRNDDKGAVIHALAEFIDQALKLRVTPRAGAHDGVIFVAEIPQSTVKRLVAHGWVRGDHQRDSAAIAAVYCRFSGGSIYVA